MKIKYFLVATLSATLLFSCDSGNKTTEGEGLAENNNIEGVEKETVDNQEFADNKQLDEGTMEFMKETASSSMMEVELGKLAQEKSKMKDVKDYAQKIVKDHQKANDELKNVAQQLNVTLPNQMMEEHQEKVKELREAKEQEFNKKFAEIMVDSHKKTVNKFNEKKDKIKNAELQNWVNTTLPTLQNHLQSAEQLKQKLEQGA